MSKLFETTTINNMILKNRFGRSATWEGIAGVDGSSTPKLTQLMVKLAEGNTGLIITGYAFVSRDGQASPFQLGVSSDDLLPGLKEMAQAVHKAGGKIVLQIAHGGLLANPDLTEQEPIGPSVMATKKGPLGREMSVEEIQGMAKSFRDGAVRAKKAGFDGIEIHAAHGLLLSQFLSPFFNHREDEYGGSIENRARILLEVVQSVREAVGDQYPLMVKLNTEDFLDGGFSIDDMLQVAGNLEGFGVDAIELSGGTALGFFSGKIEDTSSPMKKKKVYYEEAAKRFKGKVNVPLMLVGGIRSYEDSKRLLDEGITDYISMSRPLIREPDLVKRWELGDIRESECISDNACLFSSTQGKGVHCVFVSSQ